MNRDDRPAIGRWACRMEDLTIGETPVAGVDCSDRCLVLRERATWELMHNCVRHRVLLSGTSISVGRCDPDLLRGCLWLKYGERVAVGVLEPRGLANSRDARNAIYRLDCTHVKCFERNSSLGQLLDIRLNIIGPKPDLGMVGAVRSAPAVHQQRCTVTALKQQVILDCRGRQAQSDFVFVEIL